MLAAILFQFIKHKVVQSLIILSCWSQADQLKLIRQLSQYGIAATFSCDASVLKHVHPHQLQGVFYVQQNNSFLEKVEPQFFSNRYKWLLIGKSLPDVINRVRYDSEITLLRADVSEIKRDQIDENLKVYLEDIYVHPSEGAFIHPWGYWTLSDGLVVTHDYDRIKRKKNLKGYPLRIAAPVGHYSSEWYNGTYTEYVEDETLKEMDAGIRCGYGASMLISDAMNATNELVQTELWGTIVHNSSMLLKLKYGQAELSGGILRVLTSRLTLVDYIMPIWPFSVGFTYLAERESSSNMFVEPFTGSVWLTCLTIGLVLAIAQRICSRSQEEKDGSYYAVLATCLQQGMRRIPSSGMLTEPALMMIIEIRNLWDTDASAVPNGISGRWTFMVLSICSMLVHAYYTSAIVSALMSSGRSGPDSLRTLADSRYAIASEDYDYIRYLFFDVKTNWNDLEYLKKKKKTSTFYQELERGAELVQEGNTAFHSEYNQIFPHFKTFTDDQICKLQHIDTIPETMTWIMTSVNGQWTNSFRSASTWIHEIGLAKRLQSRLLALRPPCRSALLAERVNFGDVAPLLALTVSGLIMSLILLGFEILFDRWRNGRNIETDIIESRDAELKRTQKVD